MTTSIIMPKLESLKTRLKHIWIAGDYDRLSRYMEGNARDFYERLLVVPGYRVLDVACGSGKLALIAAKEMARPIRRLHPLMPKDANVFAGNSKHWWSSHNRAGKDCTTVFAEYLEVIGSRT